MSSPYFCCGVPANPWDDIFGDAATQPVAQDQAKAQDWDNPFGLAPPQPVQTRPEDARSVSTSATDNRSAGTYGEEVRSVGSATYRSVDSRGSRDSNFENKTLKDIEREEAAKKRAMKLSESLIAGDLQKGYTYQRKNAVLGGAVLTPQQATKALEGKKLAELSPDERVLVARIAMNQAKETQNQIKKTETTRKPKDATAEDCRDPETIPGMKCKADITTEDGAKRQAALMISYGKYEYDEKAGVAIYSTADHPLARARTADGKRINPIV